MQAIQGIDNPFAALVGLIAAFGISGVAILKVKNSNFRNTAIVLLAIIVVFGIAAVVIVNNHPYAQAIGTKQDTAQIKHVDTPPASVDTSKHANAITSAPSSDVHFLGQISNSQIIVHSLVTNNNEIERRDSSKASKGK